MSHMIEEYDGFIFTHIPKCGGTSFRDFINRSAKHSGIPRRNRYIPGQNWLSVEKDYYRLDHKARLKLHQKKYRVVAMHVDYDWHLKAAPYLLSPYYYTILRHPVSRVISHYQFFNKQKGRGGVKGLSLGTLDKKTREDILLTSANTSIIYVTGRGIKGRRVTKDMMEDALDILANRYGGFGLLEEITSSIQLLHESKPRWLVLSQGIEHKNAGLGHPKSLQTNLIDDIKDLNRWGIEFYEHAKILFNKRVDRLSTQC